jgi:hypothetical protein
VLLEDHTGVAVCVGMLRVIPDRCPVLALCTVDVLPVLEEDHAEVIVCIDMLRGSSCIAALSKCSASVIRLSCVLPFDIS